MVNFQIDQILYIFKIIIIIRYILGINLNKIIYYINYTKIEMIALIHRIDKNSQIKLIDKKIYHISFLINFKQNIIILF